MTGARDEACVDLRDEQYSARNHDDRAANYHASSSAHPRKPVRFVPILARTATVRAPVGPATYDCVKLIIVRSGSALLSGDFGETVVEGLFTDGAVVVA